MREKKLTARQKRFVDSFIVCGNATAAAREAGYAKPRQAGSRLLSNMAVQREISDAQAQSRNNAVMDATEAKELLTRIARAKLTDFFRPDGTVNFEARNAEAVQEMRVRTAADGGMIVNLKLESPVVAIERLAKLDGWDKQPVSPAWTLAEMVKDVVNARE